MDVANVFRADDTNVGDWHCAPFRYFDLGRAYLDILDFEPSTEGHDESVKALADRHVVLGGGGLMAKTFHPKLAHLAEQRPRLLSLVAWGIAESEYVDRSGGLVPPYPGPLPDYMSAFDLIALRDTGGNLHSRVEWAPCVSCMAPAFDKHPKVTRHAVIYEHKSIPIPIDGLDRVSNEGRSLESKVAFLGSAELVITNSYHGAYRAILLGRRVLAVPNMSKIVPISPPAGNL